jgi:hypothetical protein
MFGVDKKPDASVEVGEGVVVIKRKGVSRPLVANILKSVQASNGEITRIVLDRIVHRPHETDFGPWGVSGAFASVLVRR